MNMFMGSSGSLRVLLAAEDDSSRTQITSWLRDWGYEVVGVEDGADAWEVLRREDAPRLVILGMGIAGMSAIDVCRAARVRPLEPYIYIALVGGDDFAADVQACLDAGADDFMTEPFDANLMRLRLAAGRRVAQLQDDLIAARDALRSRALSDALTGVWNRETIMSILGREMGRGRRESNIVAVLMTDVDHFKRINDTYGHPAGDAVLREVAKRMHSVIRPYDAVGRYGGEEFLFVMPGCDRPRAIAAAERVLEAVCSDPIGLPGGQIRVTVSIGVAASGPEPRLELDELINAADAALYRAKRGGRNRVEVDRRRVTDDTTTSEMGPTLFETATALVDGLRKSVAAHDSLVVREECRALRRIAGNLGAKGVVHLTRTLDARAEAGHWDTAFGAVDAIASEVSRVTSHVVGGQSQG